MHSSAPGISLVPQCLRFGRARRTSLALESMVLLAVCGTCQSSSKRDILFSFVQYATLLPFLSPFFRHSIIKSIRLPGAFGFKVSRLTLVPVPLPTSPRLRLTILDFSPRELLHDPSASVGNAPILPSHATVLRIEKPKPLICLIRHTLALKQQQQQGGVVLQTKALSCLLFC